MATIKDVARIAGVSVSTVSHVVNGTRYVSPEKVRKVEDAIRQLDELPHFIAKRSALKSKLSESRYVLILLSKKRSLFQNQVKEKLEEIAMMVIANSGQARSDAFAALQEAKKENFEDAEKLLKEAEESLQTAHESHRELLKMDASGEVTQVSILLCHAQDHLMGSALALDLIREMIVLYQK